MSAENGANPTSGENQQVQVDAALQQAIHDRLVESGQWHRIYRLLRKKLNESGWEDELKGHARERARVQDPLNLEKLENEIKPFAENKIPASVRKEIENLIREFVEANVEDE